jgi:hypothetical protein
MSSIEKRTLLAAAAWALALGVSGAAQAQEPTSAIKACGPAIDETSIVLEYGVIVQGGNPVRTLNSLRSKLVGAKEKLEETKCADAKKKLYDFWWKVGTLESAGKIVPNGEPLEACSGPPNENVGCLIDRAGEAYMCVENLDASLCDVDTKPPKPPKPPKS